MPIHAEFFGCFPSMVACTLTPAWTLEGFLSRFIIGRTESQTVMISHNWEVSMLGWITCGRVSAPHLSPTHAAVGGGEKPAGASEV